MQENTSEQELNDRLNLIERMIAEGRREIESWGWLFVLWGIAFYCAIGLATWVQSPWAWPATVVATFLITGAVILLKGGKSHETIIGRAVGSVWAALSISAFLLFFALGFSGRLSDPHVFMAVMSALLGMANGASAFILRWKLQLACAAVWWIAAVATCFGSNTVGLIIFLAATFLCQILFGLYGMISESQMRKRRTPVHA